MGVASKHRLSASTLLPKPVSVRIGMNFGNDEEDEVSSVTTATPKPKNSRSRPSIAPTTPALDIVSKTVGTVIRNGMTTVHETSVLRTTINGQIGHAVVSTSRVFQVRYSDLVIILYDRILNHITINSITKSKIQVSCFSISLEIARKKLLYH